MASAFRPVNTSLFSAEEPTKEASSSSPRPTTAPTQPTKTLDDATTPTRDSFATSALASQKPLPVSPFPDSVQIPEPTPPTATVDSRRTGQSRDTQDVDMNGADREEHDGRDGSSDAEGSANVHGSKGKKKKASRFYCVGYPPCNLSFTRSEHLARHIRKHTGERPFHCPCGRHFSRLDNLRQHSATVHQNEDFPPDCLAAPGARSQRQIRTDRMRPTSNRTRASTGDSIRSEGRGHAKMSSMSSVASASSLGSAYSVDEPRRRPPPLMMADERPRYPGVESYRNHEGQYYLPPSPSDFSTPTSATFSHGQNSPHWGPPHSGSSQHLRTNSMYAGSRTPGRRLSVPSGANPFHSPYGFGVGGPLPGPSSLNSSSNGTFSALPPDRSSYPTQAATRRDTASAAGDEAWRRRTWHDTGDYYGPPSRLSQQVSASQLPTATTMPPMSHSSNPPSQTIRLPGIETFDRILWENENTPSINPPALLQLSEFPQWDLPRGLIRPEINNTPPRDSAGAWANEANQALLARAEQARVRFEPETHTAPRVVPLSSRTSHTPLESTPLPRHQHTLSAPLFGTPRLSPRAPWHNRPSIRTSPEGTTNSPERRNVVDRMLHPNIGSFQGFPAREQQAAIHQQPEPGRARMERIPERPPNRGGSPEFLRRLDALVAVATNEVSQGLLRFREE